MVGWGGWRIRGKEGGQGGGYGACGGAEVRRCGGEGLRSPGRWRMESEEGVGWKGWRVQRYLGFRKGVNSQRMWPDKG